MVYVLEKVRDIQFQKINILLDLKQIEKIDYKIILFIYYLYFIIYNYDFTFLHILNVKKCKNFILIYIHLFF